MSISLTINETHLTFPRFSPAANVDDIVLTSISYDDINNYISGMKVYVTDEKELIMEPCVKWAGNPNILVAIKAFGLKATVQVCRSFV